MFEFRLAEGRVSRFMYADIAVAYLHSRQAPLEWGREGNGWGGDQDTFLQQCSSMTKL